jgi:putative Holliday junction resolvase
MNDLKALKEISRPKGGRLLGLDVGDKTIGLAISDGSHVIATPLLTIPRTTKKKDLQTLLTVIEERDVYALIVGLPINMDGSEGTRAKITRGFARFINENTDLPLFFWDERLSTTVVTRTLLEADMSRKRRKEVVDKMAASYILQGALDALNYDSEQQR